MAISLKELIENPQRLTELELGALKCVYCKTVLQETITGKRKTPKGCACSDCYYEQLGRGIEKHPIASPRLRRG